MPRLKLESRIRRDQIAAAALALVAEEGLGRLSVAAVAQRVGIAPSALYRHYPGIDAVMEAVVERLHDHLQALVERATAGPGDAVDALHRLLDLHLELVRANQALFPMLVSNAFSSGEPARRRRMFGVLASYLTRVAGIVRAGQRAGTIRRDATPRTLALMFIGIVQPAAMIAVLSGGRFDSRRHARAAWRVYEQTLRGGPRAGRRLPTTRRRSTGEPR